MPQGSGVYTHGEQVTVFAPDKDKISFLVREVFDHWEGLEDTNSVSAGASATFAVTQDRTIIAVYRDDYTYLMVLIAAPLLLGTAFVLFRGMARVRWTIQNVIEKVVSMIPKQTYEKVKEEKRADLISFNQTRYFIFVGKTYWIFDDDVHLFGVCFWNYLLLMNP